MTHKPGPIYIPPFANVRLIECRDFVELVPVCAYRQFFGYGKIRAQDIPAEMKKGFMGLVLSKRPADEDIWVVMEWKQFEDDHEEEGITNYLLAGATEEDARKASADLIRFKRRSREEIIKLMECFKATEDDHAYVETHYPNFQSPVTGPGSIDANDVYQARLKALAGLQPKTINLIQQADTAETPEKRQKTEREAVDAYFAELAHHWTEDQVLAWQHNNPVATEWLCEFGRVFREPEKQVDPINYELAFNWLRRKYNLLTVAELSDAILIATGQRMGTETLKKRRDRLGLTGKRPSGPRPNVEL